MNRVFLTGGTGYIGGVLAARLRERGDTVVALVRSTSRTEALEALGAELVVGDLGDRVGMAVGMAGCDWVVHAAAELDLEASAGGMQETNVDGTRHVVEATLEAGVERFFSFSSIAYFGGSPPDGTAADESAPLQKPFPSHYSATKHAAERVVQEGAARGLSVNTVYPGLVYGPPGKRTGANALLRAIAKGRYPVVVGPDRWTSWVFIDDLVDAVVAIMSERAPGENYLLAGEAVQLRDLIRMICERAGIDPPARELSVRKARWLVRLVTPLFRLRGKRFPIGRQQLESLARHWRFSDAKARRELHWQPRGLAVGLDATIPHLLEREAA